MWTRITSILKPPIYTDEDQTRTARLIHIFLVMALCFNALRAVGFLPALPQSAPLLAEVAAAMLVSLTMLWLVRRGSVRRVAYLTWAFFFVVVNSAAVLAGGLDRPVFGINLILLIFVALTLGPYPTAGFALAGLLAGVGMIWARFHGLLPTPDPDADFVAGATTQLLNLTAAAAYLGLAAASLQAALRRARNSEYQYRTLFEEAPYGIAIANADDRFVLVNSAACQLLGYTAEEFRDRSPADFAAPEERTRQPLRERLLMRKDGTRAPVQVSVKPMADGRFQYILQDIRERQKADELLRGSERIYRQAIEAGGAVPYYQTYTAGDQATAVFAFIGEGILQMTGYRPEEFSSQLFDSLVQETRLVGEAAPYTWEDAIRRARVGELAIWKCDYRIRARDGSIRWLFDAAVELHDDQGQSLGSIGIFQDVTERKQAVEEARRLNAELEDRVAERTAELAEANRELESFAYSVSHDLRTPLRSVDGFAHILLADYPDFLPGEARDHLDRIVKSTQRMGLLIDNLLEFSRLSRKPLNRRTVSTAGLVQEVLSELRQAEGQQLEIHLGDLPDCEADPSLLRQVFQNLLGNAFKYSSKRPAAWIEVGWEAGAYFVRDNGAGFDMRFANKLFGVFQRLHTAEEFEGTGIGLAIVQRIVTRHGGRVWAEAAPGQGATFRFSLGPAA